MLETLAPILVALTAGALVIVGTRAPSARRTRASGDSERRGIRRPTRRKDDSRRLVAVRNSWDRVDLALAIGTDNAAPEFNAPIGSAAERR